jgi:serine/threonine protein kinase
MHHKNIYHRDLKEKNILVFKEGDDLVPKVADFGFAYHLDGENREGDDLGRVCGTVAYFPPEMVNVKNWDDTVFKRDIWALGMMLFTVHYVFEITSGLQNPHSTQSNTN